MSDIVEETRNEMLKNLYRNSTSLFLDEQLKDAIPDDIFRQKIIYNYLSSMNNVLSSKGINPYELDDFLKITISRRDESEDLFDLIQNDIDVLKTEPISKICSQYNDPYHLTQDFCRTFIEDYTYPKSSYVEELAWNCEKQKISQKYKAKQELKVIDKHTNSILEQKEDECNIKFSDDDAFVVCDDETEGVIHIQENKDDIYRFLNRDIVKSVNVTPREFFENPNKDKYINELIKDEYERKERIHTSFANCPFMNYIYADYNEFNWKIDDGDKEIIEKIVIERK